MVWAQEPLAAAAAAAVGGVAAAAVGVAAGFAAAARTTRCSCGGVTPETARHRTSSRPRAAGTASAGCCELSRNCHEYRTAGAARVLSEMVLMLAVWIAAPSAEQPQAHAAAGCWNC